jgi:hypothetical protein
VIATLKRLFAAQPNNEPMNTTEELKSQKHAPDGRIAVKANGKVWLAGGKTHTPDADDTVYLTVNELASVQVFAWDAKTYDVLQQQKTFFGGRLICWAPSNWSWIDGDKESRVLARTLDKNYPAFVQNSRDNEIEVPVALAKAHEDLKWVLDSNFPQRKAYEDPNRWNYNVEPGPFDRLYLPGEDLPQIYAVPFSEWQARCNDCLGVTWMPDEQQHIFRKAESLGWSEGDPI